MRKCPALGQAWRTGRVSWMKAHALVPVVALGDADVPAWIAHAARVTVRRLEEDVFGKTADRILTSSYFDLESSRADAFRAELRQLVETARSGDRDAPLEFMRMLSGRVKKAGRKRKPVREQPPKRRKGR